MNNYFYTRLKRIWVLAQIHDRWSFEYRLWAESTDQSEFVLRKLLQNQRKESVLKIRNEIYTRIERRTPKHIGIDYFHRTYIGYINKFNVRWDMLGYIPMNYNPPEERDIVICHTNISIVGTGELKPVECIFRASGEDTIQIGG